MRKSGVLLFSAVAGVVAASVSPVQAENPPRSEGRLILASVEFGDASPPQDPYEQRIHDLRQRASADPIGAVFMRSVPDYMLVRLNRELHEENACGNRLNGRFNAEQGIIDINPMREDARLALTMMHEPGHNFYAARGHAPYLIGNYTEEDRARMAALNEAVVRSMTNAKAYFHLLDGDRTFYDEQMSRKSYADMMGAFMNEIDADRPLDIAAGLEASIMAFHNRDISMDSARRQLVDWIVERGADFDSAEPRDMLISKDQLRAMGDLSPFGLQGNFMTDELVDYVQNYQRLGLQEAIAQRRSTGLSQCGASGSKIVVADTLIAGR